jgi:hypothetical protein
VKFPRRGLKGSWIPPLSCTNIIDVQVDLDGGMHPKLLPCGAAVDRG